MFKVNNNDTRTVCRRASVIIVNFEDNSHFPLVFLLLTLNR